jgi:hypothetical protein
MRPLRSRSAAIKKTKEMLMTRWILRSLLLALGAVLLLPAARANSNVNEGCSNKTIKGDYAFRVSGYILALPATTGGPALPAVVNYRDGVALASFDGKTNFEGKGGLTQKDFIVGNGLFAPNNPDDLDASSGFNTGETGSYQVFADCTGVAEIDFPAPPGAPSGTVILLKLVIAKDGREIHTVVSSLTPPGATAPVLANIHSDAERIGPLTDHR